MKKIIILFAGLALLTGNVFVAQGSQNNSGAIEVKTNANIETLAICFELAEQGNWNLPFNSYQPMKSMAREKFAAFREHQAVKLTDSLISKGFWLDAMIDVVIKSTEMPNARLVIMPDDHTLARISDDHQHSLSVINHFLQSLNDFYTDAELEEYFRENSAYYDSVIQEVKANLPGSEFIPTMENYYGKTNNSYTLVPVPTIWHTMGFGLRTDSEEGLNIFSIFGPVVVTKDPGEFGFGYTDAESISELSIHEFGHSFINPVTESESVRKLISEYEYLYQPLRASMSSQGYTTWWICFTEHLVRLGEIRIALSLGDTLGADRIRDQYVNERGFILLPHLEQQIQYYENNRDTYSSIDAFIPVLIQSLSRVDRPVTGWPAFIRHGIIPVIMLILGLVMAGIWTTEIASGKFSSQGNFFAWQEGENRLWPHIFAEYLCAAGLLIGAAGLLTQQNWASPLALASLGAMIYSGINSTGWVIAQPKRLRYGIPIWVGLVFALISVLALIFVNS